MVAGRVSLVERSRAPYESTVYETDNAGFQMAAGRAPLAVVTTGGMEDRTRSGSSFRGPSGSGGGSLVAAPRGPLMCEVGGAGQAAGAGGVSGCPAAPSAGTGCEPPWVVPPRARLASICSTSRFL